MLSAASVTKWEMGTCCSQRRRKRRTVRCGSGSWLFGVCRRDNDYEFYERALRCEMMVMNLASNKKNVTKTRNAKLLFQRCFVHLNIKKTISRPIIFLLSFSSSDCRIISVYLERWEYEDFLFCLMVRALLNSIHR